MRIAMVSEHASPLAVLGEADAGGQNVHVASLAGALADRGHDVQVLTRRDSPGLAEVEALRPGVDVVHVPAGPPEHLPKDDLAPHMPAFGRWLARRWQARPPDVVHAHFWMSGVAALEARRSVGVPTALTFHALGVVKRRHQGSRDTSPADRVDVERRIASAADAVVATCTDEVRELAALGVATGHVDVVPCGVDTAHFTPLHDVGDDPGPWTRPRGGGRLLCLGRMVERKGVDTVIEALRHLPGAEVVVAGGPAAAEVADDPEGRRLLDVARRERVADRVRLVGRVGHDDVPALVRSCDVVVTTPWYEPFGIVPLEAMACGRPLVGSAVGGLLDSVADGETGLLVPPRDPLAVAAAVRRVLDDPRLAARLGRAARRRAVETYDWARVAEATERVYAGMTRRVDLTQVRTRVGAL
ncbi:glycosyltransferase [Thalassiella azotivora]